MICTILPSWSFKTPALGVLLRGWMCNRTSSVSSVAVNHLEKMVCELSAGVNKSNICHALERLCMICGQRRGLRVARSIKMARLTLSKSLWAFTSIQVQHGLIKATNQLRSHTGNQEKPMRWCFTWFLHLSCVRSSDRLSAWARVISRDSRLFESFDVYFLTFWR